MIVSCLDQPSSHNVGKSYQHPIVPLLTLPHLKLVFRVLAGSEPPKPRKRRKSVKIDFDEHQQGSNLVPTISAAADVGKADVAVVKKARQKKEAFSHDPGES